MRNDERNERKKKRKKIDKVLNWKFDESFFRDFGKFQENFQVIELFGKFTYEKLFEYLLNSINILRVEKKNENARRCVYAYMKNSRNSVALFHTKKNYSNI